MSLGDGWEDMQVAPRAGAWIEIGLIVIWYLNDSVAPRAGAWIEIVMFMASHHNIPVAPRAGAWIEILWYSSSYFRPAGRAPCGRVD